MIRAVIFLMLGSLLMANGCQEKDVKQGIAGRVLWVEGNQMPVIIDEDKPEKARQRPEPKGIAREVYVYELTSPEQASNNGVFYSNIQTRLVEKVKANDEGYFAVSLPAGSYSVFVKEQQGLFASQFGGQGHINPVEVKKDQVTPLQLEVNYQAAY